MPEPHVIIPARLASTRFPRKVLADVGGKPMIQRVWERSRDAVGAECVHVSTDSDEVAEVAKGFGADVRMSSDQARCGTERVAELASRLDASALVNVQADDPFISSALVSESISAFFDRGLAVCTPIFRMTHEDGQTPHIVKVARSHSGRALYFSRAVIPHDRDGAEQDAELWGHIGLYVYSPDAVEAFASFGESELEKREKLEQLRFLENDIPIATFVTDYRPRAVDVPEDLERMLKDGFDE
ncbi:3-deoxy-manno-octulosonate cytidylyltransferase [Pontimonas sp.]|uniref:3-deoxy-manno-octulosonate cytidylyltransferase n=1 Tax=Pontimonas sp. TaxID=2304492 RepID=UPI0028708664|nr:3-deoxy-manno-octulosonate cytidylyltransferase [Pontimonas sp.]MDR9396801.1 3-deoxy-manno-octulosonate cytidylyltransferase [Pontimonas sp.]MDR9434221.1 3-deoxy-manno-octulosonate cytidylyltransferase [Pontimonas sp.]